MVVALRRQVDAGPVHATCCSGADQGPGQGMARTRCARLVRDPEGVRTRPQAAMGPWPGTSGLSGPVRPAAVVSQSGKGRRSYVLSVETEIRPFRVDMPDEAIADLRRRIAATRWTSRELVADRSQGVQLATIQELARYWATDYDWRGFEARLNALPQFKTEIDGVGRPLHPRQVAARRRDAADHHARLAGLDHRAARGHRPAHRPGRARRLGRGRVRPGAAVAARLRLLPRAGQPAADDRLRPAGCTRGPGGLDARPRYRRLLAGIRYDPGDPQRTDADQWHREITVRGKGRTTRTVKISHDAARALDRYLRVRARHTRHTGPSCGSGSAAGAR
jgi:hypothetical protein